jgi:hypothetical protein
MSYTEFHSGKLFPVKIEKNLEETCRIIAKRFDIELGENWESDFIDKFDEYKNKKGHATEEYFIHKDKLYRVIDHVETDAEDCFMKLSRNHDGSLSFVGSFYNGGTCFSEMMEEALDDLKPSYEEQIKETIESIIKEHNEKAPITVPAAGTLIMKYHGKERAQELFYGAAKELESNIFRSSAYMATLETVLSDKDEELAE